MRTFLLVDDDVDDVYLFCDTVIHKLPDVVCTTVGNGLELFELLDAAVANKPDVIFLDINMPKMDGWESLKRLKSTNPFSDIPVIMYSTSSAKRDIDKAYELGAVLFVTKPEQLSELADIVEAVAASAADDLAVRLQGFKNIK